MTDTDTASEKKTKSCPACFHDIDARATRCPHCTQKQPDAAGLYRDAPGRLVAGVCAGLARHFNWDATLIRVLFVVSSVLTGGVAFWVYAMLWFFVPFAPNGSAPSAKFLKWMSELFSKPEESKVERL